MREFDCLTCSTTDRRMVKAAHRKLHERGIYVKHSDAIAVVDVVVDVAQEGVKQQAVKVEALPDDDDE